jgi:hypothetical protein
MNEKGGGQMSKRNFVTVALAALVFLLGSGVAGAQTAWLDPATLVIGAVGNNADLTARVSGMANLWGVDFYVTYDATIVNMLAAATPGVCPAPDLALANTFDDTNGVAHYAVSAFGSGGCDCAATPDQAAAIFNFTRIAVGVSLIEFSIADPPGVSGMADDSAWICLGATCTWQNAQTDVPVELTSVTVE